MNGAQGIPPNDKERGPGGFPADKARRRSALRAYGHLLRDHRGRAALAVALLVGRAGLDLAMPQIFRWLLDVAIPAGNLQILAMGALFTLVLVLVRAAVHYGAVFASFDLTQRTVHQLRVRLFRHMESLPLRFFQSERQGAVVSRLTTDLGAIERFILSVFSRLAGEFVGVVAVVVAVVGLQPALGLGLVLLLPVVGVWLYWQTVRIRGLSREIQAQAGQLSARATETVGAIPTVKAYRAEEWEERRFAADSRRYWQLNMERRRFVGRMESGADLLGNLGLLAVFFAGGYLAIHGALSPGRLAAMVLYLRMMLAPLRSLVNFHLILQEGLAAMERVQEVLDLPGEGATVAGTAVPALAGAGVAAAGPGGWPDQGPGRTGEGEPGGAQVQASPADGSQGPGPQVSPGLEGEGRAAPGGRRGRSRPSGRRGASLEFVGVWFWYRPESPAVLRGVHARLEPGERVALVGRSGAGKTTLLQLVPRFYDPDQGAVLLDGRDVRTYPLDRLRDQVAWVMQEPVLFSGSVAENIAYGCSGVTQADIRRAAEMANAADFIARLPQGYDTPVGERGVQLSGGQRQRIALARALLRRPRLLLLDEATSFQDAESEERLQATFERLSDEGCTCLVVAHRLSTALRAHRILVMDGGRVVESGTHRQLLERNGLYARLYRTFFHGGWRPAPAEARPKGG